MSNLSLRLFFIDRPINQQFLKRHFKPLYNIGPDDLNSDAFEVIIILEGMVEATGGTTQARASYMPNEIEWGNRFKNVVTRGQKEKGKLTQDLSGFDICFFQDI